MAVVDASIWVAYFHPQDKFHKEAVKIVKKLIESGEQIRLPTLAFVEVAGAVSRATKSAALADKALATMRSLQAEYGDWTVTAWNPRPVQ